MALVRTRKHIIPNNRFQIVKKQPVMRTFTAGCWEKFFDIYFLVQIQDTRLREFSVCYGGHARM